MPHLDRLKPPRNGTATTLAPTSTWTTRYLDPDAGGLPAAGLVRRYGPAPVEEASRTALDLDVISVAKIAAMLAKALEASPQAPHLPGLGAGVSGRFSRDASEFADPSRAARRPSVTVRACAEIARPLMTFDSRGWR
jgi:hypothetical protein